MKDLLTTVKKAFLVVGLMIVAISVSTPAGADEEGTISAFCAGNFCSSDNLGDNHPENASHNTGLIISLTRSVSLDLRLSPVNTGKAPPGENQSGTPPIPIPNEAGSGLRYSRFGAGLSFRF